MHSTKVGTDGTTFTHNSDFSGDVVLSNDNRTLTVPFADLKAIVAEMLRIEKIQLLENASTDEILRNNI